MDVEIPYLEIISDYMLSPHELKIKQNYEKILNIIYSNPIFNYKIYSTPEVINIATVLISYPELIIYIEEYVNKETNSMNMNMNISIKKNTNIGKKRKSKQYVPLEKQDSKYIKQRRLNTESVKKNTC